MSLFSVPVVRIERIESIPGADAIELAVVGEFRSVVRTDQFEAGALVAYIPEGAILPTALVESMGLSGRLAGAEGNRVKAIRLRGQLSQGLCLAADGAWSEGDDVADVLGITKYAPPLPGEMAGQCNGVPPAHAIRYDIENWKRYPRAIADGEPVVFTEKIHGTWACFAVVAQEIPGHGCEIVASKGLAARGIFFKHDAPENAGNTYCRTAAELGIHDRIRASGLGRDVFVFGEVFGVQDLRYGAAGGGGAGAFRVFDVKADGRYLNDAELDDACNVLNLPRVPVLYRGPFSREAMAEHTDGLETVTGTAAHIREGIVMRPQAEREMPHLPHGGRVQLKSVSAAYLLRGGKKGQPEPTEFE